MTEFGTLSDGRSVAAIELSAGAMSARIVTYGARLQSLRLRGVAHDLTLGSDRLADYEAAMPYHGALVGPVVNRIVGGEAGIDDEVHRFETNQAGRHTLHSGAAGLHAKVWEVLASDGGSAQLATHLPDGEGGFPGERRIEALFEAEPPGTLRLTITAATDRPTLMNCANHSYWTMDGGETWDGQWLKVAAAEALETAEDAAPTGRVLPAAELGLDLREGRTLRVGQFAADHNLCLSRERQPLREVAWMKGRSGVRMALATTEAGLQVFDNRVSPRPGRGIHEGIALEAQGWPAAPNYPHFPSIRLDPGETYRSVTEWRFAPG